MKPLASLIAFSVALVPAGVEAQIRFGRRHAPGHEAPQPFTPERARQALVDLLRSSAAKQHMHLKLAPVDEMVKIEVQKRNDGQYDWTGAFRFNHAQRTYTFLFHHGKPFPSVPARVLIMVAVYEGTFERKDGRWIATVPKHKGTLLD